MGALLFELAVLCYFVACILSVSQLFKTSEPSKVVIFVTVAGFTFHTFNILHRFITAGYLPITGMHQASSFYAWCIVIIYFVLNFRYKANILGAFILPIVFIFMLSSSIFPKEIKPLSPVLQSSWLWIHTLFAFLGNASFAVASALGVMYLIQRKLLKSKQVHGLSKRLPSLQTIDELNYKLINLGFPLLTLAIITGAIWAETAWGTFWRWDPKEVWSLITWFVYAIIIHIRLRSGWRGRHAAILSIVGFLTVLVTFFGVNLLSHTFHSFDK